MADQNQTVQQQADALKPQPRDSQPGGEKGRQENDRAGAAKATSTQGRPGETGRQENERTAPGVASPLKEDTNSSSDLKGRQENDQRTGMPASERPAPGPDTRGPTQR